jgi:hypothetical protein
MHEMFSDYIEAKVWQTEGIDWQYVMKNSEFTPFLTHVVNYMHQCVAFDVRATLFSKLLKSDHDKMANMQRRVIKIKRATLVEDGYDALNNLGCSLRVPIHVVFVN